MSPLKLILAAGAATLSMGALADVSPVGTWTGHVHISPAASATAKQKEGIAKFLEMASKSHIKLVVKADHTFVSDVTGGPQAGHKTGKWSEKGSTVTLTTPQGSQPFKIAANGKKMTFSLPTTKMVTGEVVFTK